MLNTELQNAVGAFVAILQGSETFEAFDTARGSFQNDPVLRDIRKRFNARATELQPKQSTGSLTQEEINELRSFQKSLNAHPTTVEYIRERQRIIALLQQCNQALSAELGFDFASAAAPASCCG